MNVIEEVLDFAREKSQECTDKIQSAINPVKYRDLPFLVFSLQELTKTLEAQMDADQNRVVDGLRTFLGIEKSVIRMSCDTSETLKNFDAGRGEYVDGLQDLSVLWRLFRP